MRRIPHPYRNGELVIVIDCLDLDRWLLTSRPVEEDGWRWHVLADPDGNEFCVLQPSGGPATP
jgi:hypothetical protein